MITLVSDNPVDDYLKEILAFVYYGSIVNNPPKKANRVELGEIGCDKLSYQDLQFFLFFFFVWFLILSLY